MERTSEAPHSGGSPWKELLITASILSCWIQPMSAQGAAVTVVPSLSYGTVGGSIILDIQGFSGEVLSYSWYRKSVDNSNLIAAYSVSSGVQTPADIREKIFSNGSLLIPDLTLNDSDVYYAQIVNSGGLIAATARGQFTVYETPAKPNISANSTNILENGTLAITCSPENEGMNILWFFNNQPLSLSERMNTSEDNQTLTIKSVKREDAGSYQCEVWNLIGANRSDPLTLTVSYGPEHIMFVPNPENGEIEVKFKDPLNLMCQVGSYPPALYEWQVNGTVNSNFSSNTYVIKSVSWEDSGNYTCLAKNNVTNLSISRDITVKVVAEKSTGGGNGSSLSGGAIAGIVIGVLAGVALIGALIYFLFFRKTGGASEHHLTEHKSSAPNHSRTFSDSSPKGTDEVPYTTVNFNAQKPPAKAQSPPPTETVYSEIKKK
ncbi:carcinoembryonic antigen-related cell adhesion molecule 6-like isoform X3 [Dromiciops gliroides]|uniref:carcinoembryonic antigen-related cell adhesion molecule 6-like isoform X3 n=1 Tax=Dromiciops gliroides TaxID=33562 RepID=UPI001CC7438A|nr:carcinoembryonic antigen-related cell adhesion molecule 6-like isoform X3 [Dromiciops gliroides]